MKRAAMIALVVAALATSAATAQVRVRMSGTVRDVLNPPRPLEGATVSDGSSTATTEEDGSWELTVDPALVNTITARKAGYVTASQTVLPHLQPTLDFALLFAMTPKVSPSVVNAVPATLTYEARTLMPPTGNCVIATDDRTGQGTTMLYSSTDAAGVSKWIGGIPLTAATPSGFFHVSFEGRNCSTGNTLTDVPAAAYTIDKAPPSIGVITPVEGFLTIGVIPLPSRDGSTRVLGPVWVQVDATDDVGLTFGSITISPSAGIDCNENARGEKAHRYICGPFLFLRPGVSHTLTAVVRDLAGKASTITMAFRVAGGQ